MTNQTIICNNANDIDDAIRRSIAENRIVHIEIPDGDDADARYHLSFCSEDSSEENDGSQSFWGVDSDGDEWRVTVAA